MKKFFLIGIILFTSLLGSCNDTGYSVIFEKVNVSELKPAITLEDYPRESVSYIRNQRCFNYVSMNVEEDTDVVIGDEGLQELDLDRGEFFTLIIDITNPNENSIHEIRLKNINNGNIKTYQPGQIEDLDGDGENDILFYVNSNISRIYLGVKLDEEFDSGSEVVYEIESITYLNQGEVDYVEFPEELVKKVQVNIIALPELVNIYSNIINDTTTVVLNDITGQWGSTGIETYDFTIILYNRYFKNIEKITYKLGDTEFDVLTDVVKIGEENSEFEIEYGEYSPNECTVVSFFLENTMLSYDTGFTLISNYEDSGLNAYFGTSNMYIAIYFTDGNVVLLSDHDYSFDVLVFIEE